MVTTRQSKADAEPVEASVEVTVEADGNLNEEVAAVAAADATEVAATPTDAVGSIDEGIKPALVQQTTTTAVTEEAPGEFTVETIQTETPLEEDAATDVEGATVPEEAIDDVILETMEAAQQTAEEAGEPAVAQTIIEAEPDHVALQEGSSPPLQEGSCPPVEDNDAAPDANGASHDEQSVPSKSSESFRLFVGCVPHQFKEEDLKPYFQQVAPVREVMILRDQASGSSRGCAFAIFDDRVDAEKAIEDLDKKFTLPGAAQPIEVRFARESNKVQPAAEPNERNQLFYARAPPSAAEADVRALFADFGEVTELALFQNRAAGVSKGCGFVFFKERSAAESAINTLHEKVTMQGGFMPLTVKWADPNLNEKKRKAAEDAHDPNKDNTQVFFARIPKSAQEAAVRHVFGTVGQVKDLVLFKTHQSATVNKGCGIVTMQTHEDAAQVLEQLDGTYTFDGMDTAMVLKWVDQDLQKRRRMEREGPPSGFGGPGGHSHHGGPGHWQGGGPPFGGPPPMGRPGGFQEDEAPPPECDRNAFKLYLAGIPRTWELNDLRRIVEKFGQIVDMNLVRDKATREPKGVAFMWFRTRASAEHAIRELNNQTFDDGYGGKRVMQVSKAKPRRNPPMGMGQGGPPPGGGGGPGGFGRSPGGGFQGGFAGVRPPPQTPYQAQQQPLYYQQPPAYDPYATAPQPQQQAAYGGYQGTYQAPQQAAHSFQQPPTQAPPAYQQQPPAPGGYQQAAYNPPVVPSGGYVAPQANAAPAYGAAAGYDVQQQQQPVYGGAQYGAPAAAAPPQGGYNYGAPSAGAPQNAYGTATQPGGGGVPGQYSYAAPPQTYSDPNATGYNYGAPTS